MCFCIDSFGCLVYYDKRSEPLYTEMLGMHRQCYCYGYLVNGARMSHPIRDRRGQLGPVVRKDLSRLASKQALVEGTCYRDRAIIVALIPPSTRMSIPHRTPSPPLSSLLFGSTNEDDPSPYCASCCLHYHGILMQRGYDLTEDLKQRIFNISFLEKMRGVY